MFQLAIEWAELQLSIYFKNTADKIVVRHGVIGLVTVQLG